MKLRRKIVRLVFGLSLTLVISSVVLSWVLLTRKFAHLDERQVVNAHQSLHRELAETLSALTSKARAVAFWENTHEFIRTGNSDLLVANFSDLNELMSGMELGFLAVLDDQGRLRWAKGFDLTQAKEIPVTPELQIFLTSLRAPQGIHLLKEGPILFASSTTAVSRQAPGPHGTVVVGKPLSQELFEDLNRSTAVQVAAHRLDRTLSAEILKQAREKLTQPQAPAVFVAHPERENLTAYSLFRDSQGKPVLLAQLAVERQIAELGKPIAILLTVSALVVAVIFGLFTWLSIETLILRRIERLNQFIRKLRLEKNLDLRLQDSGKDELSRQVGLLNELLDTIQENSRTIQEKERQVLFSSRMASLGILSAGLAHEINNPLTAILLNASSAKRMLAQELPGEKGRAILQLLSAQQVAARRIARIIDSLRVYSDPGADTQQSLNLHDIVHDTVSLCVGAYCEEGIHIETRLTSQDPVVRVDPSKLQQVLLNLLSNGRDALSESDARTAEHRSILIETRDTPDGIELDVIDNGCGIREDHQERVFDAFFTTKPPGKGTGLGLSICQSFVASMAGRISLRSAPGRGTRFTIHLPAAGFAPAPLGLIQSSNRNASVESVANTRVF